MDQTSAQTEKITTYETSRTRRSIVDEKNHSDDSNNDEEYATSGFYVREKTTEKRPDSTNSAGIASNKECKDSATSVDIASDKECKDSANSAGIASDKECKENGISLQANSPASQVENGDDSKDEESSRDSKKDNSTNKTGDLDENIIKINNSGSKEDIESENDESTVSVKEQESEEDNEDAKEKCKDDVDHTKDSKKVDDSSSSKDAEEKKKIDDNDEKDAKTTEEVKKDETETNEVKEDKVEKQKEEISGKQNESEDGNSSIESVNNEEKSDPKNGKDNKVNDELKSDDNKEKQADLSTETVEGKCDETDKQNKDDKSDAVQSVSEKGKGSSDGSILKEHLEKQANGSEENMETEMDMDEDFDPSLLCPDISMDVDEAPVITNTENVPEDGSTSPLPYEASFSTLVDEITGAEVQVDLTPEEMELRSKMYGPNNPVQATKVHCTACNIHLGSALTGANNRFVHPLLKVLICKNCYHFYTSGEFEKDEDGSELYCRWCGQGGQVLCCSSCEFVFCKRCIRNNFGPRKFKEIRDSDDWNCFRCDRNQLSNLRASCAEFMEYYRTELARAQALSKTNPDLMTTDYTMCCKGGEKKEENKTPVQQKNSRRKRKDEDDPDYHPIVPEEEEPPKKKFGPSPPTGGPGYTVIPPSIRPLLPKPASGQVVRPMILQQGQKQQNQGQVFKVGNTTFRAKSPTNGQGYTVQRPSLGQGQKSNSPGYVTIPPSTAPKTNSPGYITIPPSAAPKTTTPGYIKIVPQRMQSPRPTGTYTVVSGTSNGKPTFTTVRPKQGANMPPMKHEWFEKTVRAAARVNSNLSYTLTQLNRQQSQANSVEALAMVHNKLQEVLSTSINSLIQIRKNLRTEFISGIKNIKFPPKPAPIPSTSGPIIVKDDDDVIFVNNPPAPTNLPPPPPLVLSPAVSLSKKTPIQNTSDPFANPKPSTSGVSAKPNNPCMPEKGGFLKVRSFTSLQSVPSECITIPDDPPTPTCSDVKIIEEEDPLKITDDDPLKDDKQDPPKTPIPEIPSVFDEFMVYDVKEEPTPAIKKMLGAVVMVKKSRVVDEIIRAQGLLGGKGKDNDKKEKENESKKKGKKEDKKDAKKNESKEKTGNIIESETKDENSTDKKEEEEASKRDTAKSKGTSL